MKRTLLTLLIAIITITQINSQTFETIAGTGTAGYSGDGASAINAKLNSPRHLVFDTVGNLYFADEDNHAIRKIDINGLISTIAGNGTLGYSGDGSQATSAQLDNPRGVCIDANGNIFIADSGNNVIRKIDVNGVISTIAGNGSRGFFGDNGLATSAQLNSPRGVQIDNLGNVYIADTGNRRVRKIDTNGIITTIAGNGNDYSSGDGGLAVNAGLVTPYHLGIKDNTIYVADIGGNRIRKINSSGIVSTIINDDKVHIIQNPSAIAFDNNNNLFVTGLAGVIYKIDALEKTTIAFDGGIDYASGIAFDANYNLFYADFSNNQIKKIDNSSLSTNDVFLDDKVTFFPNPTHDNIHINISNLIEVENIDLYDGMGKLIKSVKGNNILFLNNKETIKIPLKSPGIYFIKVKSKQGEITKKIVKL
jgi:sugar lactone lactonase YvrE